MIRGEEEEAVTAKPGLGTVIADVFEDGIEGHARFLFGVGILYRQHDEMKFAVVGHIGVRRKNVNAVNECDATGQPPDDLMDFCPDLVLVLEAALPVFHFAAQISSCVEPEPGVVLSLIARAIEVMPVVGQAVHRVSVDGGCLSRLEAAEKHTGTIQTPHARLRGNGRRSGAKAQPLRLHRV